MLMVTALAGVLALRYQAVAIAALGLFGGFLTPILLSTGEDHPWFLFGYILALDVGALALARMRSWLPLETFSFIGTALIYAGWLAKFHPDNNLSATCFVLLFYALYAGSGAVQPLFSTGQFLTALVLAVVS